MASSVLCAAVRAASPFGRKIERLHRERVAAGIIGATKLKSASAVTPATMPEPAQDVFWIGDEWRDRPSIPMIQRAVAAEFGLSVDEMLASRRNREVLVPRYIAMHLAKKLTINSLPEIGRRFAGRDHTTVLNALRKIDERLVQDADMRLRVDRLRASICGGFSLQYWGA